MKQPEPTLIWITRSEPGASRLAQRLGAAGWPCLIMPTLAIKPVRLTAALPAHFDVAIALSEHAVQHAPAELWQAADQIIAVGAATAGALAQRGVTAQVPDLASSEGLLDGPLQPFMKPGTEVALVSGEGGRAVLQEALTAAGCHLFDAQVYRREAVTSLDPSGRNDLSAVAAIVVSSGDGFEAAGRLWFDASLSADVPVFAPSQRVVDLATGVGFAGATNCRGADAESVLTALEQSMQVAPLKTTAARAQGLMRKQRMSDEQQKSAVSADNNDDVDATEIADREIEAPSGAAEPSEPPVTEPDDAETSVAESEPADADQRSDDRAEDVTAPAPPGKTKSGRGLAFLSLLFALAAAGGAGYLYYELIYKRPFEQKMAAVDDALSAASDGAQRETRALGERFDALEQAFQQVRGEQDSAIDAALGEQQRRLESTEQSLIESLNRVANQAPPSQQQWKLAELEYLLRIANHRVLMERDADGARRLLETADAILTELDDFGLHEVRALLAEEILALKRVGKNDVQGLFLRLEAVKRGLDGLPLRVPEYLSSPPVARSAEEATAEARGPLDALAESMGTFFKFRTLETQIKPLLAPDEIEYLELNLRLMLEQAQLGALRGQSDVFEQSLDNAIEWLNQFMDADADTVTDLVNELTALRDISVARDLPDVSGSLRALMRTERSAS